MMNNRKILGLCDLHSSPEIGGLTESRALGAVTFLGRYALMDFALSNFANSGIDGVCILVKDFPHSVLGHVGSGDVWTSNTKTGYEYIFYNEFGMNSPDLNTDINNVLANKNVLRTLKHGVDYIVVAPAHYLCSMDFNPIIEQHIKNNSKVTAVYVPIHNGTKSFSESHVLDVDETGKVTDYHPNNKNEKDIDVFLDTFIINADLFDQILRRAPQINKTFSIRDMVEYLFSNEGLEVDTYKFEHHVIPVTTLEEYYNNSFALLSYEQRRKIFREDWPIYTRTHDTPPAHYGEHCRVKDAIISNGCIIDGEVEHSILSRNVIVEKGATVKDCIVFTKSIIKKDVKVEYVLTDKSVVISSDIKGKEKPVFLKTGSKL